MKKISGSRTRLRTVTIIWFVLAGLAVPLLVSAAKAPAPPSKQVQPEHVILVVLEGVGQEALKAGPMPVLSRLVKEGSVTWSATGVNPSLRLPAMASLLTGLPVEKHGITWNSFDFIRGYPRPPTVFDYLDLSGGRDSTIFFMDESLYQLAKPEPYTDYQMCGPLKPECSTTTVVGYIREYFRKATSGHGYGHAILSLPHFLVVHLPEPGRAGLAQGVNSPAYRESLRTVDQAISSILGIYRDLGLMDRTTVFVTALNNTGETKGGGNGAGAAAAAAPPRMLWAAWGAGIKSGHLIKQPVSIMDTGATVMRTLGLETHTEWESKAVEEIFSTPRPASPVSAHQGEPGGFSERTPR
ncbi:MAG: hypothetical protein FJ249_09310 [Nitrospira sp.]|nr:hypothetical protein [Nitrospira sp.]